jgi:hypothetical protein
VITFGKYREAIQRGDVAMKSVLSRFLVEPTPLVERNGRTIGRDPIGASERREKGCALAFCRAAHA